MEFEILMHLRMRAGLNTSLSQSKNIKSALKSETNNIFYDEFDHPIGYVLWANVSKETLTSILSNSEFLRFSHEWKEGRYALIIDIVFRKEWRNDGLKKFRKFLQKKPLISYVKRNSLIIRKRKKNKHLLLLSQEIAK